MMAAASPRFNTSDTPESTVSGPRGDGYSLATWEISSMGHRRGDLAVGFERPLRHLRHAVVLPNPLRAAPAQLRALRRGLPEVVDGVGQAGGVVWRDEESASGLRQYLRECAAPRLHHGH